MIFGSRFSLHLPADRLHFVHPPPSRGPGKRCFAGPEGAEARLSGEPSRETSQFLVTISASGHVVSLVMSFLLLGE